MGIYPLLIPYSRCPKKHMASWEITERAKEELAVVSSDHLIVCDIENEPFANSKMYHLCCWFTYSFNGDFQ